MAHLSRPGPLASDTASDEKVGPRSDPTVGKVPARSAEGDEGALLRGCDSRVKGEGIAAVGTRRDNHVAVFVEREVGAIDGVAVFTSDHLERTSVARGNTLPHVIQAISVLPVTELNSTIVIDLVSGCASSRGDKGGAA